MTGFTTEDYRDRVGEESNSTLPVRANRGLCLVDDLDCLGRDEIDNLTDT